MVWLPPPLCALPCPVRCVCVCVLVVGLGTAAHCGGTHAGVALCLAPDHHTHLPRCPRLSPLSSLLPPNPPSHTHTQMALLTPHTHGVLCVPRPIHSLTHWLPHCPHTLHTHTGGCACAHPPALMRHHTHSAGTGVALAWLLWCCGHHHHAPCATHTQGLVVGAMVVVGGGRVGTVWLPRHATHSPCLPPHTPHPPPHTPWRVVCLARLATPTTTTQPHHTHHNSHCATMVVAIGHHAVHTHPTLATHTKGKHRRGCGFWCGTTTTLVLAIRCLLFFPSCPPTPFSLSLACTHTPHPLINNTTIPSIPCVWCVVLWEWTDGWTTLWLSTPHTALLMGVLIGDTIQPFHPPSPLSLCFCPPPTTTPSLFSAHHTQTQRRKGEWGWTCWCCGCVMDGVGGMCGLWVVLCVGCVLHGLLIPSLCPHQTTTTLPFSSPFTTPLFCLCVCVEKGVDQKVDGVEWSVVCGMQHISHCAFIKPSPTPVCLSSFTIPFSLSNSFSSSFLPCLVCLDRKSEGQVWDSPCQTHCAPHPIHTTLFPSNHAPLFNEHMVDWFVMHQNTFHASMVLCPLLMHKPFPPHSCFAIPFHHSTHQPPLLFSFSLFPFHSLSQHSCHAIIQHSFTPSMCSL